MGLQPITFALTNSCTTDICYVGW